MAPLLVRCAGGELMTERDSSRSKISWNWDRVLLVLALVAAIGFGLDQHWADEKIIAALTRDVQSAQNERDARKQKKPQWRASASKPFSSNITPMWPR